MKVRMSGFPARTWMPFMVLSGREKGPVQCTDEQLHTHANFGSTVNRGSAVALGLRNEELVSEEGGMQAKPLLHFSRGTVACSIWFNGIRPQRSQALQGYSLCESFKAMNGTFSNVTRHHNRTTWQVHTTVNTSPLPKRKKKRILAFRWVQTKFLRIVG
jgi:hypothetical protein